MPLSLFPTTSSALGDNTPLYNNAISLETPSLSSFLQRMLFKRFLRCKTNLRSGMASWAGLEVEERSPFRSLPCPSLAYLPDPYYQVIVESSISPFQKAKAIVSQGGNLRLYSIHRHSNFSQRYSESYLTFRRMV